MKRITTTSALRALAKKINDVTKGVPADEAYQVDLDTELSKIEDGGDAVVDEKSELC